MCAKPKVYRFHLMKRKKILPKCIFLKDFPKTFCFALNKDKTKFNWCNLET